MTMVPGAEDFFAGIGIRCELLSFKEKNELLRLLQKTFGCLSNPDDSKKSTATHSWYFSRRALLEYDTIRDSEFYLLDKPSDHCYYCLCEELPTSDEVMQFFEASGGTVDLYLWDPEMDWTLILTHNRNIYCANKR